MMSISIRPERPEDYAAIAHVHARAFRNRATEALIVLIHRQRAAFDPDLSLVAERGGRIVGHALFSPRVIRLLDTDIRAVNLAPLAVDPDFQGQGAGSQLMRIGHEVAIDKGHALSFLLGHAGYYPRFGYTTGAFGSTQATVPLSEFPEKHVDVTERTPVPDDIAGLRQLWRKAEAGVDFSIDPGDALLDWLSPNPSVKVTVYARGDEIVGYTRVHREHPERPSAFLARDPEAGREVAAALARYLPLGAESLILPVHPLSAAAPAFPGTEVRAFPAAMAAPLVSGILDEYLAQVTSGRRPAGRPMWPVEFDLE